VPGSADETGAAGYRPLLFSIAYGMTGSVGDAEVIDTRWRLTGPPQCSEKRFGGCVRAVGLRVQPWSHVRGVVPARRFSGAGQ
jgi:hypothetical protein